MSQSRRPTATPRPLDPRRLAALACIMLLAWLAPLAGARTTPGPEGDAALRTRLDDALARMADTGDFSAGALELDAIADDLIAAGEAPKAGALLRDLGVERRLAHQMSEVGSDALTRYRQLRGCDALRREIALAMTDADDVAKAYGVFARLEQAHSLATLSRSPTLTSAICVVFDRPVIARRNENVTAGAPPEDVFAYFHKNESRMLFGIDSMPTSALVYVVDAAVPIDQLEWALSRYKGNRTVGQRFHEINYDNGYFKEGREKRLNEQGDGYTLPNIKRYGGICADQAHFAVTVGKAIGVPTAYVTARGPDVGHAWVGYLKRSGRGYAWDFDEGRYEDYEDIKGDITDPQTGRKVTDGHVGLTALLMRTSDDDRAEAVALCDLADRVGALRKRPSTRPEWATLDAELALLQAGLRKAPAYAPGWEHVRRLAASRALTTDQKRFWGEAVMRLCGEDHVDFAWDVIRPMIESVEDPEAQEPMWTWAGKQFRKRPDLEAEALLSRGRMWEKAGEKGKAWGDYRDAAVRYANDGTSVVEALDELGRLAASANDTSYILDVYADVWRRVDQPGSEGAAFYRQSNYYQVGTRYVDALERAGKANDAKRVRDRIAKGDAE